MKKETIYKIAIAVLIVLNLFQVVGRYLAHTPLGEPIKMATERLGLDEKQEVNFRELAQAHRNKMIDIQNKQEAWTETYFNNPSDSLLTEISLLQKSKIQLTEEHFRAIKALLNKDQYDEFVKFKKNALNKIMRVQSKNNPSLQN